MVISSIITVALLVICSVFVKKQSQREFVLKTSAILTVIIHFSNLPVNFFLTGGNAYIESNHILPVWPCNIIMWMLLVCAMLGNKKSVLFHLFADFCFYAGIVCSVVGIAFNSNFDANPTLADYDVLKGLVSHSVMLFGCIYLYVGKFIKIRVFNALSLAVGFPIFVICGLSINALYRAFGMTPPDAMLLESNPYIPISPIILGILAVLVLFAILAIYEMRLPKEGRWYSIAKNYFNEEHWFTKLGHHL